MAIRIGFTENHGVTKEISANPPKGVSFTVLEPTGNPPAYIRSPIKGYLRRYDSLGCDLIEAHLSPIITKNKWIYYTACFQESAAFSFYSLPLPIQIRSAFLKYLMEKQNLKKLIFWSNAGLKTLKKYGKLSTHIIDSKTTVVYPAIRHVPDELLHESNKNNRFNILFSGGFFIKGGVNVIDAFERVLKVYPDTTLTLCCDEKTDFSTLNPALKEKYLKKIKNNKSILIMGRLPRERLLTDILPNADVYLLPSYQEAFGFSLLEAMAWGVPVIASNIFAIPEMIEDHVNGILIDILGFNPHKIFRGSVVNTIPVDFQNHVTDSLYAAIIELIESPSLAVKLSAEGLRIVRSKFSFQERNAKMLEIYSSALS